MEESSIDKKGVLRAMSIALVVSLLAILVLGWQYRRLEKERIPALEERIEQIEAKSTLDKFMNLRIVGDQAGAVKYLTERAVLQKDEREFNLLADFRTYETLNVSQLEGGAFRFAVQAGDLVEVITLVKILDKYYIDSIQIAG